MSSGSSLEEIDELVESLETDDVGQKRYMMYRIFDRLLDAIYEDRDFDVEEEERVMQLRDSEGYLYKLSQDFLMSSSTGEKQRKLEKMIEYVESRR